MPKKRGKPKGSTKSKTKNKSNSKQVGGLTDKEAKRRLEIYGENKIERKKKVSPIELLIDQFKSPVILLLIVAAVVSMVVDFIHGETSID
ncbi:MAG: hypothetical protein F7B61_03250, partial [Caldisphaeraceae archaeon]|nr:hypothetical protein [Caldisphaeraceae archaeon]